MLCSPDMSSGNTSQRSPKNDQLGLVLISPLSGHLVGSLRIEIEALFTYTAVAPAIAPVIKNEDADAPLMEQTDVVQTVGNVTGIAMTKKEDMVRGRRGDQPSV